MTPTVHVLIVDDQEPFRSAARLVVEMTDGFEVIGEAADGEQALDLVATLAPNLVLMDITMPGIDGIAATRRIAREHPGIRVVVLSTYPEYQRQALDAGAVAFVSKSAFGPDEIVAAWTADV
ncbi:MAG TPA: response regulator transcription factor [Acidimicrobiales bacterium]|nr:response regulator transcription factor [Acidimicrobiales bacterium]